MKPGMWQYEESYCGGWLFVVRRRVSCVVNVLSVDTLENPIVMKRLSRQ